MSHPTEETLNDYVDRLLSEIERATVQRHLERCGDCKRTIGELQALIGAAAALGDLEPSRDLLPKIRNAVVRTDRAWLRWVAAAAIVGFVALLAVLQFGIGGPSAPLDSLVADVHAAEVEYQRAAEALARGIDARRDEIDPATLALLNKNLALIDDAIGEVRLALNRDGAVLENTHRMTALYNKKLDLLRRVSRLSS